MLCIFLTFACSIFSFFVIEKPFRQVFSFRILLALVLPINGLLVLFCFLIIHNHGYPTQQRLGFNPALVETARSAHLLKEGDCKPNVEFKHRESAYCLLGDAQADKIDYVILGDSHAMRIQRIFDTVSKDLKIKGLFGGTSGCPPLIGIWPVRGHPHPNQQSRTCYNFIKNSVELSQKLKIDRIILVARWDYYIDSLNSGAFTDITDSSMDFGGVEKARATYEKFVFDTFNQYSRLGKEVVVFFQVPNQDISINRILEKLMQQSSIKQRAHTLESLKNTGVIQVQHLKRQHLAQKPWKEILMNHQNSNLLKIVDPTTYFCKQGFCPILSSDGAFYTDANHASDFGLLRLEPEIRAIFTHK